MNAILRPVTSDRLATLPPSCYRSFSDWRGLSPLSLLRSRQAIRRFRPTWPRRRTGLSLRAQPPAELRPITGRNSERRRAAFDGRRGAGYTKRAYAKALVAETSLLRSRMGNRTENTLAFLRLLLTQRTLTSQVSFLSGAQAAAAGADSMRLSGNASEIRP